MELKERKTRLEFIQHYLDTNYEEVLKGDREEIIENKIEISGIFDYLCYKYKAEYYYFCRDKAIKELGTDKVEKMINDISKVEKSYYPDNTFGGLGTSIDENYGS